MKDIPGFYFYPGDWLSNPHVSEMNDAQYRAYHTLLCKSWLSEPPATLPNDDALLARLAGVSMETWEQIAAPIKARFKVNGNDRLYHPKLLATFKEAKRKYENRAKAASQRWKKDGQNA